MLAVCWAAVRVIFHQTIYDQTGLCFFFLTRFHPCFSDMALDAKGWEKLPYHILLDICSYLRVCDRNGFARTCKTFNDVVDSQRLWRRFKFCFRYPSDERFEKCFERYGQHMHNIDIELDQSESSNRDNALRILQGICLLKQRKLKCLSVKFTGENPCFYSGREFITALTTLLGPPQEGHVNIYPIQELDLSEMSVTLDDKFLDNISNHNPHLQILNIQNKVLVCKVSPSAVSRLAQRCCELQALHLFSCSLTDEVLLEFAQHDRAPLDVLSIVCRGAQTKAFTCETWRALTNRLPNLRVWLAFDHTCPTDRVADFMKADIPVSRLSMETYTYIYDEVNQASCCYSNTLQSFRLYTPISRNSPELHKALIQLATTCHSLEEMHVQCVLDSNTVERILELRPVLRDRGSHTLRDKPWAVSYSPNRAQSDVF